MGKTSAGRHARKPFSGCSRNSSPLIPLFLGVNARPQDDHCRMREVMSLIESDENAQSL